MRKSSTECGFDLPSLEQKIPKASNIISQQENGEKKKKLVLVFPNRTRPDLIQGDDSLWAGSGGLGRLFKTKLQKEDSSDIST